ncbi:MAG TPA: SRPBCC domain-containing protein [Mycobacteriales bacterium]
MSEQEVTFERIFHAKPGMVFRAFTDPDLVARWWVAADEKIEVETLEPRAGGSWRFVNTDADGTNVFHGVYHSVAEDRIVQTFEYSEFPGVVLLETLTFTDLGDGRTRFTDTSVFPATAAETYGGGGGAAESMDRLDALLRTL